MKLIPIFLIANYIILEISGSTLDDARQELDALDILSIGLQGQLHILMNDQADILRSQLATMRLQSETEIANQTDNLLSKITTLADNTQFGTGANVDACAQSAKTDLQDFQNELNDRLEDCYGNMIMTGNNMLYSTFNKVWDEYDIDYQCNRMDYVQCSTTHEDENCADFIINNIQTAKTNMLRMTELLKSEMENRITGMNFPCKQMIEEELALYPNLILNFVSTCLESLSANAFKVIC